MNKTLDNKRSYRQFCGVARALDYLGERWTLLIIRDLLLAPRRYSDLLTGLPGLTSNMLAARLKQMEEDGLVEKERVPRPTPAVVYRLTHAGLDLEPLIEAAGQWGERFLTCPSVDEHQDIAWMLPRLKRRYRGGYQMTLELNLEGRRFTVELQPQNVIVRERPCPDAELFVAGNFDNMYDLFFGPTTASEVLARGGLMVEGKFGRWPKLLAAFSLR